MKVDHLFPAELINSKTFFCNFNKLS